MTEDSNTSGGQLQSRPLHSDALPPPKAWSRANARPLLTPLPQMQRVMLESASLVVVWDASFDPGKLRIMGGA